MRYEDIYFQLYLLSPVSLKAIAPCRTKLHNHQPLNKMIIGKTNNRYQNCNNVPTENKVPV